MGGGKLKKFIWPILIGVAVGAGSSHLRIKFSKKSYDSVLYSQQNLPVIEQILEDERQYYDNIPIRNGDSMNPAKGIEIFNQEVKPKLEDLLNVHEYKEPSIRYGLESPFALGLLSFWLILGAGSLGSVFFHSQDFWDQLKTKEKRMLKPIGKIGFFLGVGFYSMFQISDSFQLNKYFTPVEQVNVCYSDTVFETDNPASLSIITAHEYTHHIQHIKNFMKNKVESEGHSLGVAMHLGRQMYEQTNNPDYVKITKQYNLPLIASFYKDLCDELGVEPKEELINGLKSLPINAHAKGAVLFALREYQHGDQIYRAVLDGKKDLLLNPPTE